jgi:hypothetical protein
MTLLILRVSIERYVVILLNFLVIFDSSLLLVCLSTHPKRFIFFLILIVVFICLSMHRIPLNILYIAGFMVMISFSFCLSWKVFIFPSIMEHFTGYYNLGWQFFSLRASNTSFMPSSLLASVEKFAVLLMGLPLYRT